jgi:hypothetical protein
MIATSRYPRLRLNRGLMASERDRRLGAYRAVRGRRTPLELAGGQQRRTLGSKLRLEPLPRPSIGPLVAEHRLARQHAGIQATHAGASRGAGGAQVPIVSAGEALALVDSASARCPSGAETRKQGSWCNSMPSAYGVGIPREEEMRYRLPEDFFCDQRDAGYPLPAAPGCLTASMRRSATCAIPILWADPADAGADPGGA